MSPQNLTTELEAVFILSAAALRCQQQPRCVPYKRVELWVQLSITVGDRWPQCTVAYCKQMLVIILYSSGSHSCGLQ